MMPSKINQRIEKIKKRYNDEMTALANEVLRSRIIPYCQKHCLSFAMLNGTPYLIDAKNNYVSVPKFIENLFEVDDQQYNRKLFYFIEDYKHSENFDLMLADQKHFKRKCQNEHASNSLYSLTCL